MHAPRPLVLGLALAAAAPAVAATDPAPKNCGLTPPKYHRIRVDRGSTCGFGLATYRALKAYSDKQGFVSAVEKSFVLKPRYKGKTYPMDCRALARAHGEFDFYCNDLNRRGTHVVRFDNATLP